MKKDNVEALLADAVEPKQILFRASVEHDFDKVVIIGRYNDGTGVVLTSDNSPEELAVAAAWIQKLVFETVGFG